MPLSIPGRLHCGGSPAAAHSPQRGSTAPGSGDKDAVSHQTHPCPCQAPPASPWYLQGTEQPLAVLDRGHRRAPGCCEHGQGVVPQEGEEAAGEREAVSRIQGLGWIQLFSWRALQSPRRKCLILPSPEEGWPQAMRGCSCPRDGDAGGCATLHPKCPGHLLKFSCTRCSLRYCSSDSRNFMSGMMDCSKRRGHWGGQGGHIQQAREDPRGAPCHGQAVPGVVLLLTWAFWVPQKRWCRRAWSRYLHPQASGCHWKMRAPGCAWQCPFPAAKKKHKKRLGLCPPHQPPRAQLHHVSIPGALWASGHLG